MAQPYTYVIVGGGLAGASAIDGIRERDPQGSILLLSAENHLPYHRPPLTKSLWSGKKTVEQIFVQSKDYYRQSGVTPLLGARVVSINPSSKLVTDSQGRGFEYRKLLLATGGTPRRLPIPGGELTGVLYYRSLDDYNALKPQALPGRSAILIGGGFIGSELAASLAEIGVAVTMVFPDDYLGSNVFPDYLGHSLMRYYQQRGIRVLSHDKPKAFHRIEGGFVVVTEQGLELETQMLVVGIGVKPAAELAEEAGLETKNGIVVNSQLQTSDPDIYAAGDNCYFPYMALDKMTRVEHWDNALIQGKWAGRNMAGAQQDYTHQPYFFSDLFEFGYEATGECHAHMDTLADWQQENRKGVVYYFQNKRIRGVLLCGIYGRVDAARELIRRGEAIPAQKLVGAIR